MNNDLGQKTTSLEPSRSLHSDMPANSSRPEARDEAVATTFVQNLSKERFQENAANNAQKYDLRPGRFNSISFHNFHSENKSK